MNRYKGILKNREDAAIKLQDVIPMQRLKDESWKIISVSRGGLELASYIRGKFENTLDILFSESVYTPNNDECEVARVSETEEIVINENLVSAFEIEYDYIYGEAHRKYEEKILSSIYRCRKGKAFLSMKNEIVLLVDDGSETGMKFMLALKTILAQNPKAIYIAAPLFPSDVLEMLEAYADEIFFLHDVNDYVKTSLYYEELEEINDEMIEKLLEEK